MPRYSLSEPPTALIVVAGAGCSRTARPPRSGSPGRPTRRSARWCLIVGFDSSSCWAISVRYQSRSDRSCRIRRRVSSPRARCSRTTLERRRGRVHAVERGVGDGVAEEAPAVAPEQFVVGPAEVRRGEDHPAHARLRQPADPAGRAPRSGPPVRAAADRRPGGSRRARSSPGPAARSPGSEAARPPGSGPSGPPGRPDPEDRLGRRADVVGHRALELLERLGRAGEGRSRGIRACADRSWLGEDEPDHLVSDRGRPRT